MKERIAVYPGTFDPITNGHIDIIERGVKLFDTLIIAIAESPMKTPLFTIEERIDMVKKVIGKREDVMVERFGDLLVNYVIRKKASAVLRGLRVVTDFEYEFQMALTNRKLDQSIETIFLMTAEHHSYISSRFLKEIARLGGKIDNFVPLSIVTRIEERCRKIKEIIRNV